MVAAWPRGTALVDDAISLVEMGLTSAEEAIRVYGDLAAERLR